MKRAKIALTAIAIFAVVGGALAFKANRFGSFVYKTAVVGGSCSVTVTNYTTAQLLNVPTITGSYRASNPGPCTTTIAYLRN